MIEYLIESKYITHAQSCSGRYDMTMEISVKEIDQFDLFFNDFLRNFNDCVENHDRFFYLDSSYLGRGLLLDGIDERKQLDALIELKGSSFSKDFIKKNKSNSFLEINKIDQKILNSIKFDSSKNIIDIASTNAKFVRFLEIINYYFHLCHLSNVLNLTFYNIPINNILILF